MQLPPVPGSGPAAKLARRAPASRRCQQRREAASHQVLFDRREIRGVLNLEQAYLNDEEFEQFFEALDADGDGRVTLLDYLRIPDLLVARTGFCAARA